MGHYEDAEDFLRRASKRDPLTVLAAADRIAMVLAAQTHAMLALVRTQQAVRGEGICGEILPNALPMSPKVVCELIYGHRSPWHENGEFGGAPTRWRAEQ